MMKKKIAVLFFGPLTVLILASAYAVFALRADGQMVFPKKPHEQFVQAPKMSMDGQTRIVSWVLPVDCARNSYEVQDVGYESGSKKLWGGVENASCTRMENGYGCKAEAHPEMNGEGKQWQIQASAYECSDGDYYISEVAVTN